MAAAEEIRFCEPTRNDWPRLWKAQRAFVSAETLREKEHLDCAANRYYYSLLHVAYQFLGEESPDGDDWGHAELTNEYIRRYEGHEHKQPATEAVSRAVWLRNLADYSPLNVWKRKLDLARPLVADMVVRALRRAEDQEGPT